MGLQRDESIGTESGEMDADMRVAAFTWRIGGVCRSGLAFVRRCGGGRGVSQSKRRRSRRRRAATTKSRLSWWWYLWEQ